MRMRALVFCSLLVLVTAPMVRANYREFTAIPVDPQIENQLAGVAAATFAAAPKVTRGNLSMTMIDLTDPAHPRRGSFDGQIGYHPASVVKMFYLVHVYHQQQKGQVTFDPELQRAIHDMIVDSSNDATAYVVDRMTGTTSGPELSPWQFRRFVYKRSLMNRFFAPLGYDRINVVGKTFCEDIYGRDKQLLGPNRERRNRIDTESAAAMLLWIMRHEAVSAAATEEMLTLMHRRIPATADMKSDDGNVIGFTGEGLPAGAQLWSKPGDTSEVRHDATYVELPNGKKYLFVVFTRGDAVNLQLLPDISRRIVALW